MSIFPVVDPLEAASELSSWAQTLLREKNYVDSGTDVSVALGITCP